MIIGSSIQIVGGLICIATGFGGPLGMGLIAMGASSLISGFMNEASEGSFFAGWAGGQISGAATMLPFLGVPIGAFAGSVITDWIDNGWDNIKWGKAGLSAAVAWLFDIPAIAISDSLGRALYKDIGMQILLSYRGVLLGVVSGLLDRILGRVKR